MPYTANIPRNSRFSANRMNRTNDKNTGMEYLITKEGLPDNKPTVIQYLSPEVIFYTIDDVVEMTGWSKRVVQRLFNRSDFPSANLGKAKLVESHALAAYFAVRRERPDEDLGTGE